MNLLRRNVESVRFAYNITSSLIQHSRNFCSDVFWRETTQEQLSTQQNDEDWRNENIKKIPNWNSEANINGSGRERKSFHFVEMMSFVKKSISSQRESENLHVKKCPSSSFDLRPVLEGEEDKTVASFRNKAHSHANNIGKEI